MKHLSNFITVGFITLILLSLVASCTNETTTGNHDETITAADSTIQDSTQLKTRALKKKISTKAYYYKSLAAFANGKATINLSDLASLEGKQINLVVLYESDAPWADVFSSGKFEITGNDLLNGLMDSYALQIVKQFSIDEANEGIVMEAKDKLDNPIETARELSIVEHVLMVHVKEIPPVETVEETADREK